MYTVGSLADLISGSDTPKKKAVKVKEVKYEKPIVAKPKVNKNSNSLAEKKQATFKQNIVKSPQNGKPKFNKGKRYNKFEKSAEEKGEPQLNVTTDMNETVEQTSGAIIQNKKLNNAEKRVMLKRKAADSEIPKKPKKPKIVSKIVENPSNNDEKTIFVGNVPLDTKEKELRQLFAKYGKVDTIRFRGVPAADMKTPQKVALFQKKFHPKRKSMIAYVVFKSEEDAANAKNANGKEFKNHHLRIDSANRKVEPDKKKGIFVGNLPLDAEEEDLRKVFDICGAIYNVRLIRDQKTNVGKGFGFVNFENADSVEFALQLSNAKLGKRELRVTRCTNPEEKNKKKTADGKKIRERYAVHINNLPKNAKETNIRELFKKCGKILSVRISTGNQKDLFCYINFENSRAVKKAVNMKNPTLLGEILKINECKPNLKKEIKQSHPAIYINNIPLNTKTEEVHKLFEDCGNILSVKLFLKKIRETGVGFVNFENDTSVEKALKKNVTLRNNKLGITRKSAKKSKTESEKENKDEETVDKDDDQSADDESDADEELVRDINGQKNWEDDSDSSEAEDDEDTENESDDENDDDKDVENGGNKEEDTENEESDDDDDDDEDDDEDK